MMRKLMWIAFVCLGTLAGVAFAEGHDGLLNLVRPESESVLNNPFHALDACYSGRVPATSPAPIDPPSPPSVPQPPVPPTEPKPPKTACEEGLKGRIQVGGWVHGNEVAADSGHYALQVPANLRDELSKVDGTHARLSGELELKKDGDNSCHFIVNVTAINKGKKLSDYCNTDCAGKYYAFANIAQSCWVPSHDDKPVSLHADGSNLCEARRNLCQLIRGDATLDSILPDPDQYDFVCHVKAPKDLKKGPVAFAKKKS